MIHLQTGHSLQSIYLIKGDLEVVFDPSQDVWVKPVPISSWACVFGTSFILVFQGAVHCQHARNAMAGHGSVGRVLRRARKGWPGLPWSNASSHWNALWRRPQSGIHDRLEALELSHGRFSGHIGHISRQACVKIWSRNRKESALGESISKNGTWVPAEHSIHWGKEILVICPPVSPSRCIWSCTHVNNLQKLGYKTDTLW